MSLRNPMCRSMIVFAGGMYPILATAKAHACQAYNSCTVNGSYYLEYNNSGTASGGNAATAVQGTTYGGISLVGEDQGTGTGVYGCSNCFGAVPSTGPY